MKVALYIRVSTERQAKDGDSLEDQENDLRKFCDYRKYHIYKCYIERGKSGSNTNRPEYQKLINDIEGRKIKAVIVKKLDRLSRSLLDFENLMKLMQEKEVEFISLKENFDTTNAMGKAMLRVALVFAQLEREQTSERITDVMTFRASKGLYNGGQTLFGYTSINKELVPYKKERIVVELMFSKFLAVKSVTTTTRFLNETGYRDRNQQLFDSRQVDKMLRNSTYIGKVRWNSEEYQGIHRPIISEEHFLETQNIFKKRQYGFRPNKIEALLQKLMICGNCMMPMTINYCFNKQKKKYYYYRCASTIAKGSLTKSNCPIKYIPFTKIEARIIEIFLSLSEEKQFKRIENRVNKYNQAIEKEIQQIQADLSKLEDDLKKTQENKVKYLDSLISSQFLSEERDQINKHITNIELDEKQLKGAILKQQFEQTTKEEEKINLSDMKIKLITFKMEHQNYLFKQLREYFLEMIKEIICYPEHISISFRFLPWEEDFSL